MVKVDKLVRTRRRTVALVVERDGSLVVRAPLRLAEYRIRAFVESHAEWIAKKQAQARASAPKLRQYEEGESFLFMGKRYPLKVVDASSATLAFKDGCFHLSKAAQPEAEGMFQKWYRRQARRVLEARVDALARQHGFQPGKVRISSARTRWGSCSPKGTLSFTWRLVLAPAEVIDYVVIHELVHLKVKNHSRAFWLEVEKLLPGYKRLRKWLKVEGARLG